MSAGRWVAGLTLLALTGVSLVRPGPAPRLGPLLDPVHGIWSVAGSADAPATAGLRMPGLTAPVEVVFDDRAVPHIFARNELDAIRALGYVVARDRLFQLELQWRAGAGRLTELVGAAALPVDRESRGLGLPDAARARYDALPPQARDRRLLEAFSDGVNARIAALTAREIPLEYHLLDRRPAPWEPVDSYYLLARMGWTLAYSDLEDTRARAAALVGDAAADALYPRESPIQEPIQPNGSGAPRFDLPPLPPPGLPSTARTAAPPPLLAAARRRPEGLEPDALGSNNWAVAPARSADGNALLAGDPHLELTLPSIWYEAHLVVPDSLDVYGVTIPGATGIVIGFTRALAWTFTNTEADVLDRYAEVVDDTTGPTRYRVDGAWRPVRVVTEAYRDRGGALLRTDTLRYTHRGPLLRAADGWQSLRWTVLEAGGEQGIFGRAARAADARAWLDSMAGYRSPAQNMLVADRGGTIAIRSTGRFPIRPGDRGDLVLPGDTSASDWTGEWSAGEMPQAIAPTQGYLASANQQPVDPRVDPRYLGANWYSPWRALRINALLRADSAVTPDAMRRYQTDPGSAAADLFVPAFLAAAARNPGRDSVALAARLLKEWDRRYTRDNSRAILYETVLRELGDRLWDELEPSRGRGELPSPGYAVVLGLLRDSASAWWDDRRTPTVVEQRDHIIADAMAAALHEVSDRYGNPDGDGWRWDRVRHARVNHLLYLPALSAPGIPVQGGQSTLSPTSGSGSFGASWRMVVELGPQVRAWGTYPGGQSGNPASAHYDDRIRQWSDGQLDTLRVPATADQVPGRGSRIRFDVMGND